jgi:hypothetical protein
VNRQGKATLGRGAVKGNKAYAYRNGKKAERIFDGVINNSPGQCLYITLTRNYKPSVEGIKASWEQMQAAIPRLMRQIRRVKSGAYQYVLEAHESGGCHCHVIYNTNIGGTENEADPDLGVIFAIENIIKKKWKGGYEVRRIEKDKLANIRRYFLKSIGSEGHVEDALARQREGYTGKEGEVQRRKDLKLIKTFAYSIFYGIKATGHSATKQAGGAEAMSANIPGIENASGTLTAGASPAMEPATAGGGAAVGTPREASKGAEVICGGGNTNATGIGSLGAPPAVEPPPAGASPAVEPATAGGGAAVGTPRGALKGAEAIRGGGNTNATGIGSFLAAFLK